MEPRTRAAILLVILAGATIMTLPRLAPSLLRRATPFFLYHPAPLPPDMSSPARWGIARGEEVWLEASDGVRLHAWWVPPPEEGAASPLPPARGPGPNCGSALFFHGNAGHLADRAEIADRLSRRGLSVLLVDYRGYGRSQGEPSEEGLYRDGMAAYRYVVDRRGVEPGRVVAVGHSLGGAVAAAVASRAQVGGSVVTAAFRSLPDIARDLYPWLPRSWFDWQPAPYSTLERMAELSGPVLVGRGSRDDLIPRSHVRALYEAAPAPKRWVEARGADHNDLWFDPEFWQELDRFLADALGCRGPDSGRSRTR